MRKVTSENRLLAFALALLMAVMPMAMAGCSGTAQQQAQKVVNVLTDAKQYIVLANQFAIDFQTLDPKLAAEVQEYAALVGANLDSAIAIGNAYIGNASSGSYQNLLVAVDAIANGVDKKVLEAAKISNPQTQQKILLILGAFAALIHTAYIILAQNASKKQLQALPKTARVDFEQVRPYLDRAVAKAELAKLGYPAGTMEAAGF